MKTCLFIVAVYVFIVLLQIIYLKFHEGKNHGETR